jgi:integrase
MIVAKKRSVDARRWLGVYQYESLKKKISGRPDVCYYVTYKVDGKKTTEKVGWKSEGYTPQIAAEIRSDRLREARHGNKVKTQKEIRRDQVKQNRTLNEVAHVYFENRGGNPLSGKFDRYRYDKHVAPILGKRKINSITTLDIERIKKNMTGLADATIWGALELVRRLTNYGCRINLCEPLGFKIDMPKRDNEVIEYLTAEQLQRLYEVLKSWAAQDVARMIKLAMLTGMRRGEIFKLCDDDIDFKQRIITLRKPKGGKTVSIPMSLAVAAALKLQKQWRDQKFPNSPFVFPGKNGRQRSECKSVDRIKRKACLPESFRIFHGLRHNFAVHLANSGEYSLDMIGQLLTHKSSAMTRRYAKFLPDTMREASEKATVIIENQLSGKPKSKAEGKDAA